MGSFAFTCAVSGLPIERGDAVRYGMLTKNPYEDNVKCYATDEWFPRVFPLRAKYNDYGSIEDIEIGAAADSWFDGLDIDLIEREQGENPCHDVPVKKGLSQEQFLEALWEDRVLVKPTTSYSLWSERLRPEGQEFMHMPVPGATSPVPVRQMMIRQDVWDALCKVEITTDYGVFSEKKLTMPSFREAAQSSWDALVGPFDHPKEFSEMYALMDKAPHPLANTLVRNAVTSTNGTATAFGLVARRFRAGKMKPEEVTPFLDTVAEFMYLEMLLGTVRYMWRPSYSAGPQFGEWFLHAKVTAEIANIAREVAKVKQEEYDE